MEWPEIDKKFWLVFAVLFIVTQALNIWAMFPNYGGWEVFGFPLVYIQYQQGAGYSYFNLLFLVIDLFIWYLAAKAVLYAHGQITKYKILK